MKLNIGYVPLRADIENMSKVNMLKSKQQLQQRIISIVKPNPKTMQIIYEALLHGTKTLKTKNLEILNKADIIKKHFNLKVVRSWN